MRGFLRGIGSALLASLLAVALLPIVPGAFASSARGSDEVGLAAGSYVPGELIVGYAKSGKSTLSMKTQSVMKTFGAVEESVLESPVGDATSIARISVPEEHAEELMEALEKRSDVAFVQRNFVYKLLERDVGDCDEAVAHTAGAVGFVDDVDAATDQRVEALGGQTSVLSVGDLAAATDDTSIEKQYYLDEWNETGERGANVVKAWDTSRAEGSVTVAVLDTGVFAQHPDLAANIDTDHMKDIYRDAQLEDEGGYPAGSISDGDGHGTHVAGIIAGVANNGCGVAGVSYNATVLPLKVFADAGDDTDSYLLCRAYSYLEDLILGGDVDNLRVINMSLGGYEIEYEDFLLMKSIEVMRDTYNVLTVCAGGNGDDAGEPMTATMAPSDFSAALSVTSLDKDGTNSHWADYNSEKDISAPGESLLSTYYNDSDGFVGYATGSGSSMAAPVVSGIAALLWAADPSLSVDEVVEALELTAHPVDRSKDYRPSSGSAGAVDAAAALAYALNPPMRFFDVDYTGETVDGWAARWVSKAAYEGLMSGDRDVATQELTGYFRPLDGLTRAQAVIVLYRAMTGASSDEAWGSNATAFVDVGVSDYWTNAVNWAYANGYVKGFSDAPDEFRPNAPISRQELAIILWRACGKPPAHSDAAYRACADAGSEWADATAALTWTAEQGILSGSVDPDGTHLNPYAATTRAQAAKIFSTGKAYMS